MGFLSWMRGLLGDSPRPAPTRRASRPAARVEQPAPALPDRRREDKRSAPGPRPAGVGNLDRHGPMTVVLEGPEEQLVWRLSRRVETGDFQVPQLATTTLAALDLAGRPSAEVAAVVGLITTDPLLSSELLRMANSALYGGRVPVDSLHQAVMRVGLRSLRGLIFSVSLRGVLLKERVLAEYAEEVWRQSVAVGSVARAIARPLGFDAEQAYLVGLLHDVGKVALLSLLREEGKRGGDLTTALVGQVFHTLHEKAGAAMARAWRLPDSVASVAGCHHEPLANARHPREAALALLAHQLDLYTSLGDDAGFVALARHPAFEVLAASDPTRADVLRAARAELDRIGDGVLGRA